MTPLKAFCSILRAGTSLMVDSRHTNFSGTPLQKDLASYFFCTEAGSGVCPVCGVSEQTATSSSKHPPTGPCSALYASLAVFVLKRHCSQLPLPGIFRRNGFTGLFRRPGIPPLYPERPPRVCSHPAKSFGMLLSNALYWSLTQFCGARHYWSTRTFTFEYLLDLAAVVPSDAL
jgi:hypothetical protein